MWKYFSFCPKCGTKYQQDQQQTRQHQCVNCGFIFYENQSPTASAIIVDKNELLLVRRAIEPGLGKLDVVGGFMNYEESPQEAVRREAREEINGEIEIVSIFDVYGPIPYVFQDRVNHNTDVYFECKLLTPRTQLKAADDAQGIEWFSLDDLPTTEEIAFESGKLAVERLRQSSQVPPHA